MKRLDSYGKSSVKRGAVQDVLIKRGGFHLHGPNDLQMEKEVSDQVDVVLAVLERYEQWLSEK